MVCLGHLFEYRYLAYDSEEQEVEEEVELRDKNSGTKLTAIDLGEKGFRELICGMYFVGYISFCFPSFKSVFRQERAFMSFLFVWNL